MRMPPDKKIIGAARRESKRAESHQGTLPMVATRQIPGATVTEADPTLVTRNTTEPAADTNPFQATKPEPVKAMEGGPTMTSSFTAAPVTVTVESEDVCAAMAIDPRLIVPLLMRVTDAPPPTNSDPTEAKFGAAKVVIVPTLVTDKL